MRKLQKTKTVECFKTVFYNFDHCYKCENLKYCFKEANEEYEYDLYKEKIAKILISFIS